MRSPPPHVALHTVYDYSLRIRKKGEVAPGCHDLQTNSPAHHPPCSSRFSSSPLMKNDLELPPFQRPTCCYPPEEKQNTYQKRTERRKRAYRRKDNRRKKGYYERTSQSLIQRLSPSQSFAQVPPDGSILWFLTISGAPQGSQSLLPDWLRLLVEFLSKWGVP